jgi:hypothetical protein
VLNCLPVRSNCYAVELRAVAAQALGLLAEVEGARFGQRLGQAEFVAGCVRVFCGLVCGS